MRRVLALVSLLLLVALSARAPHAQAPPPPAAASPAATRAPEPPYRSPQAICLSPDGLRAYVVDHTASVVSVLDVRSRKVTREISVADHPSHAALSRDGRTLYVTSLYAAQVQAVDVGSGQVERTFATGNEPWGVVVAGDRLYVANAVSDSVTEIEPKTGRRRDIAVGRAPRYLAAAPDLATLVVANGLSRSVSLVDVSAGRVTQTRPIGLASVLRDVLCLPDGNTAVVAHLVARDNAVPVQMERGWIVSNGISLVDLRRPDRYVTLLLDRVLHGAANPWGLAASKGGERIYVSLSGVHQVAIVDTKAALRVAAATPPDAVKTRAEDVDVLDREKVGRRVDCGGIGPRGLAYSAATGELLVANYFSGTVSFLDGTSGALRHVAALGPAREPSPWRQGETLFNDARIGYQGWMSCASCHQEDATTDGLNWDLPNDGVGNPKNAKSMHDVHDTPPAMWSGVREDMNEAVQAGQRFLGRLPVAENHLALMTFLNDPPRAPNPYRDREPEGAHRGQAAFEKARCDVCHPPPTYTNRRKHDLGLAPEREFYVRFDTPSLRDCYRTPPYLHDGRAKTLEDVFLVHDPLHVHGRTDWLTPQEFTDLITFLRTL